MILSKIIIIIISVWFIRKIGRFIFGIKIKSEKSTATQQKIRRKKNMDIQDADYEDVE